MAVAGPPNAGREPRLEPAHRGGARRGAGGRALSQRPARSRCRGWRRRRALARRERRAVARRSCAAAHGPDGRHDTASDAVGHAAPAPDDRVVPAARLAAPIGGHVQSPRICSTTSSPPRREGPRGRGGEGAGPRPEAIRGLRVRIAGTPRSSARRDSRSARRGCGEDRGRAPRGVVAPRHAVGPRRRRARRRRERRTSRRSCASARTAGSAATTAATSSAGAYEARRRGAAARPARVDPAGRAPGRRRRSPSRVAAALDRVRSYDGPGGHARPAGRRRRRRCCATARARPASRAPGRSRRCSTTTRSAACSTARR